MKILSKYKDYYDYLSGIYGVDPKLILDRCKGYANVISKYEHEKTKTDRITLIICGKLIEGYRYQNRIYYGEDLKQFSNTENSKWNGKNYPHTTIMDYTYNRPREKTYALIPVEGYSHITEKYDCPILIKSGWDSFNEFPRLSELDLANFIPAEEMYKMLSEYLAQKIDKQQETVDNLTDIQKLENKGFDKITSFRPNYGNK